MMHQDSLEPAAIQFTLEHLLESVCQAIRIFSPCLLYPQEPLKVTYYLAVLFFG